MRFLTSENAKRRNLQVSEEFSCSHAESKLVLQMRGSARFYHQQCSRCGKNFQTFKRRELSNEQLKSAVPHDERIRSQFWDDKFARFDEVHNNLLEAQRNEFQCRYSQYLDSDDWQSLRTQVFVRDNFTCQACHENPATQVHHLTYERVFQEHLSDLVAVCRPCHKLQHPEHHTIPQWINDCIAKLEELIEKNNA